MITKEQILQNIENNQHVGDASPWISAGYFMTGNGLLDSIVVNSAAKETSFAFEAALKTGIYKNYSIMGGNFLYNSLYNSTVANLLSKSKVIKSNSFSKKITSRLRFNFLSNNGIKVPERLTRDNVVKTLEERMAYYGGLHNATPTSELVRTGFGIGKDYSGVFNNLRKIIGDNLNDAVKTAKNYNGWSSKNLSKLIYSNLFDVNGSKFGDDEASYFIKHADLTDMYNFFDNRSGKNVAEKIVNAVNDFRTTGKALDKNLIDDYLRSLIKDEKISSLQSIADDLGIKVNLQTLKGVKEATEKIGTFFTTKNVSERILSSTAMKSMVGVANPLNLVALGITAGSIVASFGQSNAINNFISSHLYNTKESEILMSSESIDSINSSSRIQETNLKNLSLAYSDVNTARRYMNDLDPISLDLDSYHLDNYDIKTENN